MILRVLNGVAAITWLVVLVVFLSGYYTPTKPVIAIAMLDAAYLCVIGALRDDG